MSDKPFLIIHDLVNPKTGHTYKEDNLLLRHNIPLWSLVEILPPNDPLEQSPEDLEGVGVRLYVVRLERDCDGTPLYRLGIRDSSHDDGDDRYRAFGGYPEEWLRVIKLPDASGR